MKFRSWIGVIWHYMALGIPKELQQGIEGFSTSDLAGVLLKYEQQIVVFEYINRQVDTLE